MRIRFLRYVQAVLEFFEIVTIVIYALLTLVTLTLGWFDAKNARLILPSIVMLALGVVFHGTLLTLLMPLGVVALLLVFRHSTKREPFDYQKHLLALLDSGTISQAQYEEESARITDYNA